MAELRALLSVSGPLAELNAERYKSFPTAPSKQALFSFDGQAYAKNALNANSLTIPQVHWLQQRLRILCGLYGVLRPLDAIKPYRLEMGCKLTGKKLSQQLGASDLYSFWDDRVAKAVAADVAALPEAERCVVNVASQEYAAVVLKRHTGQLGVPIITCAFPGPAVHAKAARGGIVRYAATVGATSPEQLKGFTGANGEWRFCERQSTDTTLVFLRCEPKAKKRAGVDGDEGEEDSKPVASKRSKKRA